MKKSKRGTASAVPRSMRATGQTLNALLSSVVSKVVFGFVGGLASDLLGADRVMLINAAVMAGAVLVFARWSAGNAELTRQEG